MQAASADWRAPEPDLGNQGIPADLGRSARNAGAVETFAQNMAENVFLSSMSQLEVDPEVSGSDPDQQILAGELASAVIEIALREVSGRGSPSSRSAGAQTDDGQAEELDGSGPGGGFLSVDTEMDPVQELQTFKDLHLHQPPLYQSGLPVVGSLDYPDAPPTTPLLPELERSRHSFARKLKGGLAKVFLPSPPPPTPKEAEDGAGPVGGPRAELMEHLMDSLSADDLARRCFEVGAKVEAFAEALSCYIIDRVLSASSGEQRADDEDLHLLAHRLAGSIITSSLDEAEISV
ncbi:putative A-kinase anchor protein 11-like [Scophthalmus maximus]|uniref:Putative A-kinase anchor protein 11-like n=1 Tax=Scophthalmus maximus TaxID=52904 RepID=A0A2U9B0S4_SCOMX|nr:putative A-kinase anchor protein 11-like [Scophthalmus maximus]